MPPKSPWPPAQAEDHSYSNGCAFQGASQQELPGPACSSEGSGLPSENLHAHTRGAGSHQKAQAKARRGTSFFSFFGFIMKTKQMPQEKGP